jgi:hypothetical protein
VIRPNKASDPTVITPQLKESPDPATVLKQLYKELEKPTKDWDQVRQWVQECPDVCKEKDEEGCHPLHYASVHNAPLDVIRLLVTKWPNAVKEKTVQGPDTNASPHGLLPLYMACLTNAPLDVIQLLVITWPGAVKVKDSNGFIPLHAACHTNAPLDVIQFLVETWPDAVKEKTIQGPNAVSAHGLLPLHLACCTNAPLDVIRLLVTKWPNAVKEKTSQG